ncbi:MAG: helix-turn-helix domain-containing protein, partial [Patescibacteria group bacterium]|nr:helix-turn-helix domain-containing protein [Patescibacteria group bacterium]
MDQLLEKNLITTKDAGEISGYTSDYLARLARSGKIAGKRIGHSWLIDKESLARFVGEQGDRKLDQARALARTREEEYRAHHSLLNRAARKLTTPINVPNLGITENAFRSQALALSIACAVLISGAYAAQAASLPQAGANAIALAQEIASGFNATFGDIPSRIASRIDEAGASTQKRLSEVATRNALVSANLASPLLANPDLSSLQMAFAENTSAHAPMLTSPKSAALTTDDLRSFASDAYAFLTTPARITDSLMHAYVAIGEKSYAAINGSFDAYQSFVMNSGEHALAGAVSARDALAAAPRVISEMNLALGNAVIEAAHAAIEADVALAYGAATAAPASAQATVAFLGGTGDALAGFAAHAPALATAAFLEAAAAPARLGPAIAQAVFDAEYAGATHFVAASHAISDGYLALVLGTGRAAYDGTSSGLALANDASSFAVAAPAALEDAYLGALGKSALALDTLARVPTVANTLSVVHTTSAPMLAAVAPTLSVAEQIALATYETIQNFFDSTNRTIAALFAPPPTIVLPTGVPKAGVIVVATSSPARAIANSYPTYTTTTVVRGVSEDFVNQSLTSLRNSVLATVAGLIRPVAAQGITNMTTIQQVNMIQDLSNLIVRNGDFRGGTLANASLVSAGTASFTDLTASTASLGATSVSGALSATGGLSAGTNVSAPYFTATAATATSTFAGSLALDTNGFVYATSTKNVGIGVLSPAALLAVQNSTSTQPIFVANNAAGSEVYRLTNGGFVGIGTSTPDAALALQQTTNGTTLISAYRATDTAPSGDFIDYRSHAGTLLFRVDNSGNLLAGGIVNSGSQTITSTSTPQFRVQYDASDEWTSTVTSLGSTTIAVNGTTPSLTFTPQSNQLNTFNFTNAASASILSIDTLNKRIGLGTTTPASILDIFGTDAVHLPVGTTGQRPSEALTGQVRYNTTTHQFEGYGDNAVWQGLGGVIDADQSTKITADTNNANEDYLRF